MPFKIEDIRITPETGPGQSDDDERHEHPAFAMIGINRVQHGGASGGLYGSALDKHRTTMCISIRRSYMIHHLSRDWFHGSDELIEIELSAAQYAELLSSHNIGYGVPCTLRAYDGALVPRIPDKALTEQTRVTDNFRTRMQEIRKKLQPRVNAIGKLAEKLSAKARDQLKIELGVILQEIDSNVPFVLDSFNEAASKIVTAAKQEIEAFSMHRIVQAGLKAIGGDQAEPPKQLAMPKCRLRWIPGLITPPNHKGPIAEPCRLDAGHEGECTFILDARARGWKPSSEMERQLAQGPEGR